MVARAVEEGKAMGKGAADGGVIGPSVRYKRTLFAYYSSGGGASRVERFPKPNDTTDWTAAPRLERGVVGLVRMLASGPPGDRLSWPLRRRRPRPPASRLARSALA